MPKLSTVRAITQGERDLRDWHRNLRIGAAVAGFGMMLASLYQLHWAGTLIGFPTFAAGAMAGSLELLLAFNAGAVTSIRKRTERGAEGGYYWSLWLIFAFLLCISIAANVGHAMVALSEWFSDGGAPTVMAEHRVYVYAIGSAVAAMVPLGGSFGLHISGFVRARGAGSDWVDENGTGALLDTTAPVPAPVRKAPAVPRPAVKVPADQPQDRTPEPPDEPLMPAPQDTTSAEAEEEQQTALEIEPVEVLSEEELYAIYKRARDAEEHHRFTARGDLNPTQLGRRLGQSPQNGRKRVGPRFDSRYRAEKQEERGDGVDLDGLEAGSGTSQAS
ncbi:type IV pilus assembly protein FimV [Streptomyces sp. CA-181903]|uniref:type IV pilus assembly protein FimV n=1 Tax=Streptomyces sp. CA-181903 TaxID=3240055 RepID=UPI003D92F5FB